MITMKKIIMTKISSTHNYIEPRIVGMVARLPVVGQCLYIALEEDRDYHLTSNAIRTSTVTSASYYSDCEGNQSIRFNTLNSTYNLEVLPDDSN
jgi:hypothetical protein